MDMENAKAYLDPWMKIENSDFFDQQLHKELTKENPIKNEKVRALAKSEATDDVLYYVENYEMNFVVVHLTYAINIDANYPKMKFYKTFSEWVENGMLIDNQKYED